MLTGIDDRGEAGAGVERSHRPGTCDRDARHADRAARKPQAQPPMLSFSFATPIAFMTIFS